MTEKILVALLVGIVLRFIAARGITQYVKSAKTDSEMKEEFGFHFYILSYVLGTVLKYVGLTLLFAYLVNKYLLS